MSQWHLSEKLSAEQRDELRSQWPLDAEGFPHRQAARAVIFDSTGRIFMILGHDFDDLNHRWWFTVGGGIDPGESPREGVAREVFEETGLRVAPQRFIGPVLFRESTFYFAKDTRRQDELFFLLTVDDDERAVIDNDDHSWTALESSLLDEQRWWKLEDLENVEEPVYPQGLTTMAAQWLSGWDGQCRHVVEK